MNALYPHQQEVYDHPALVRVVGWGRQRGATTLAFHEAFRVLNGGGVCLLIKPYWSYGLTLARQLVQSSPDIQFSARTARFTRREQNGLIQLANPVSIPQDIQPDLLIVDDASRVANYYYRKIKNRLILPQCWLLLGTPVAPAADPKDEHWFRRAYFEALGSDDSVAFAGAPFPNPMDMPRLQGELDPEVYTQHILGEWITRDPQTS